MPNWCSTYLRFKGPKESVKKFYDLMVGFEKQGSSIENSWDSSWLGTFIERGLRRDPLDRDHGIIGNCKFKAKTYNCRGNITYIDHNDEEVIIDTETAWGPMLEMFYDLKAKYAPDLKITWQAIEPGMGLYVTNDPAYKGKINIESWDDEIESTDCAILFDVIDILSDKIGSNLQDLIEKSLGYAIHPADIPVYEISQCLYKQPDALNVFFTPWEYEADE